MLRFPVPGHVCHIIFQCGMHEIVTTLRAEYPVGWQNRQLNCDRVSHGFLSRYRQRRVICADGNAAARAARRRGQRQPPATPAAPAIAWAELVAFVRREEVAGRLTLTPPAPDPPGWRLGEIVHAVWMGVLLLAAAPLLLLGLVPYLWWLRRLETTDTPITPGRRPRIPPGSRRLRIMT
jgi:hypothetical protein